MPRVTTPERAYCCSLAPSWAILVSQRRRSSFLNPSGGQERFRHVPRNTPYICARGVVYMIRASVVFQELVTPLNGTALAVHTTVHSSVR